MFVFFKNFEINVKEDRQRLTFCFVLAPANPETAPDAQVPWSPDYSPWTLSVQKILRARASLAIPRRKLTPRRPLPDPEPTGPQAARLRNWLISPPPAPVPSPSDHVPLGTEDWCQISQTMTKLRFCLDSIRLGCI